MPQKWTRNGTEMVKELREQECYRNGPEMEQKWDINGEGIGETGVP